MVVWSSPVADGDWDGETASSLSARFRRQCETVGMFFVGSIEPCDEVPQWSLDTGLFDGVVLPAHMSDVAVFEVGKALFYSLTLDVASTCGDTSEKALRLSEERTARAVLRGAVELFETALEATVPDEKHDRMRVMAQIEMTRRFMACPPETTRTALLTCAMALVDFILLRFVMVHARAEMRTVTGEGKP